MSHTEEIERLSVLHRNGDLTDGEFAAEKAKLIEVPKKKRFTLKKLAPILVLVAILVIALAIKLLLKGNNTNSPSYMKQVTAYQEGSDGYVVYFILADGNGEMTSASGAYDITVTEKDSHYDPNAREYEDHESTVYHTTGAIDARDFQATKIGMGAFEHDALICSLGRITFSAPAEATGRVKVTFTPDGQPPLSGSDDISFSGQ